jgi:hypothetical protein
MRPPLLASAADFVDVPQKVGWVCINAICAGPLKFVLAVAAGKETNPKRTGSLRSQHVPDTVADDGGRLHADT